MKWLRKLKSVFENRQPVQRRARPHLEELEPRYCPVARSLFWNPVGTTGFWGVAGAWRVGSTMGAFATTVPGSEDTVNFVLAGKDCTLNVDATVNAFVESFPSTTVIDVGTHHLTVKKNDANSQFSFTAGQFSFSSDSGILTLDGVRAGGWQSNAQFVGSQGTVEVIGGAELKLTMAGPTWVGRTHFEIGDASGSVISDMYIAPSAAASLDLGVGGDLDIRGAGLLDFSNGSDFSVVPGSGNLNTMSNQGEIKRENAAGTASIYMVLYQSGVLNINYGTLRAGGELNPASIYQTGGTTTVHVGGELIVDNKFMMEGGEFDTACVFDTTNGGTVTTSGDFVFDSGVVDLSVGVSNTNTLTWDNPSGSITFGSGCTLYERLDGTGAGSDYLFSPSIVMGGTLRIYLINDYPSGSGAFLLGANQGSLTGSFAHMYIGLGTTLLTDTYDVSIFTAAGSSYLDVVRK